MAPDFIVMRHSQPGAPHFLARHSSRSIINAGDGAHEHPTQALLDAYTIRKHKGKLKGLKVAILGDINKPRRPLERLPAHAHGGGCGGQRPADPDSAGVRSHGLPGDLQWRRRSKGPTW